jgi:electron transfer flavoprotein beta subunit
MRIIVPVKQVPETSSVRMDPETGTIVRDGATAIVNPLDLYAIEAAVQLREKHGGSVEVISMGPRKAEAAIREALAMGCDRGHLLSDKAFGGADTWATSYVLAQAIRSLGEFDLVLAGERATDGDTGQVGPGIASWLEIPCVTYVADIVVEQGAETNESPRTLRLERLVENGYQQLKVRLPALLTVVKEIATPRLPTLSGKKRSIRAEVPILGTKDLNVEPSYIGLNGSPTRVVRIRTPKVTRGGNRIDARESPTHAVDELVAFLRKKGLVPEVDQ